MMAAIYDAMTGDLISGGLQGCNMTGDALQTAVRIAHERSETVHLSDDDGEWLVHSDGTCEPIELEDEERFEYEIGRAEYREER